MKLKHPQNCTSMGWKMMINHQFFGPPFSNEAMGSMKIYQLQSSNIGGSAPILRPFGGENDDKP
jgi:hypothetical protein